MQEPPESLWEAAVTKGLTSDADILAALAARFRMPVADLEQVSNEARDALPESLARKYRVLPLRVTSSTIDIATADPHDLDCERNVGFATGRTVRMNLAAPARIVERITEVYRPERTVEKILEGMQQYDVQLEASPDEDVDIAASRASERPIIKLVDHIVAEGIQTRASDIHLEAQEAQIVVNYRIDGVLREAMVLPRPVGIPLVSRIKIMAELDIADRLRPQDGRARVMVNGTRVDLRVSTLPASSGEKVVIRILDSRAHRPQHRPPRALGARAGATSGPAEPQGRNRSRHRADRVGEDDDALFRLAHDPDARREHRHRRRSG